MDILWKYVLPGIVGYLLGNISMGIMVSSFYGVDIRRVGSLNPGMTNVLRTLGVFPAVLTLIGDSLKAFAAAWIGRLLGGDLGMLIGGLAAMIGHVWPVFFRFEGGKGIAAALGMVCAIKPLMGLLMFAFELLVAGVTRYVSLASILSCIIYPFVTALFFRGSDNFWLYVGFAAAGAALMIFGHRKNIERLIKGTENKLDFGEIKQVSEQRKTTER